MNEDPKENGLSRRDVLRNVMRNQVAIATKLMILMDRLSIDQPNGKAPITDADLFGA